MPLKLQKKSLTLFMCIILLNDPSSYTQHELHIKFFYFITIHIIAGVYSDFWEVFSL